MFIQGFIVLKALVLESIREKENFLMNLACYVYKVKQRLITAASRKVNSKRTTSKVLV